MVVTIWNEYRHEKEMPAVGAIYPRGLHACIGEFLGREEGIEVQLASLDEPDHGLAPEVLERTDVLLWWGHMFHHMVDDAVVDRVYDRVMRGMGLIALHSAHKSKIFMRLMGTTGNLCWHDSARERMFTVAPGHPIAAGLPAHFELGEEEMYGEPFDIPQPNETVFLSWFDSGYVFRSGVCFTRGRGRIFYFQPGHEEYPTYQKPLVQRILCNAVRYVCPDTVVDALDCPCVPRLEPAAE